jgi:hypothetical protein
MIAQIVANGHKGFQAIVFSSQTMKYRTIVLDRFFKDQAEQELRRQLPDVQIAVNEADFAQKLQVLLEDEE